MKVRKVSLTTRVLIINILVLLIANATLGAVSISQTKKSMKQAIQQRMLDAANSAAAAVDGDILETVQKDDADTEGYQAIYHTLDNFRNSIDVEYIYGLRQSDDDTFTFTVDPDPDDPAEFGAEAETTAAMRKAGKGKAAVDDEPYEDEWGRFYSAYSPVFNSSGDVAGIIAADFSAEWFEKEISRHVITTAIIAACTMAVSIVIILILIGNMKKGFNTLNHKLCDLADGSGDLSKEINITSGDEFEVIADSMNTFIGQIREIVLGVKNSVESSTSSSNELSDIAEQASETMNSLSDAVTGVSKGAMQQAQDVSEAAENVSMIVEKLTIMHEMIDKAENYAENMHNNSNEVSGSFHVLIKAIHDSMTELQEVTQEISTVGASVDSVIEAADAINSIASQTNLLSLNASIEAARAGEAGKGFAVVAGEIGTLAVQANESAVSIKDIMDNLKKQTTKAISLVKELNTAMSEQNHSSTYSSQHLDTLFQDIERTKETLDIIRSEVMEIEGACTALDNTVESLSAISEENAASADVTASSVSEITGIIRTVSDKADHIKDMSDELGSMVSSYHA